jgi:hypothetical protein
VPPLCSAHFSCLLLFALLQDDFDALFQLLDRDGSGTVTYQGFVQAFMSLNVNNGGDDGGTDGQGPANTVVM